jgi:hypothetical protein
LDIQGFKIQLAVGAGLEELYIGTVQILLEPALELLSKFDVGVSRRIQNRQSAWDGMI